MVRSGPAGRAQADVYLADCENDAEDEDRNFRLMPFQSEDIEKVTNAYSKGYI